MLWGCLRSGCGGGREPVEEEEGGGGHCDVVPETRRETDGREDCIDSSDQVIELFVFWRVSRGGERAVIVGGDRSGRCLSAVSLGDFELSVELREGLKKSRCGGWLTQQREKAAQSRSVTRIQRCRNRQFEH